MSNPAVDQTYEIWQGNYDVMRIAVTDGDGGNVNLSSATARWWMGRSAKATGDDIYLQKATGGSGIQITNDAGLYYLEITLEPDDTNELTRTGRFYHEAEVILSGGEVVTVMTGDFVLHPTIIEPVP